MQSPMILTRGNRINRLTAGALGLALLASVATGAIPIAAEGRNDEIDSRTTEEIYFLEQNVWDYDSSADVAGEADLSKVAHGLCEVIGTGCVDGEPSADVAGEADPEGRSGETGSRTTEEIHFLEENVWDYDELTQPAGDADAPLSSNEIRFLEENVWDYDGFAQPGGDADAPLSSATLPHGEPGEDY